MYLLFDATDSTFCVVNTFPDASVTSNWSRDIPHTFKHYYLGGRIVPFMATPMKSAQVVATIDDTFSYGEVVEHYPELFI